MIKEDLIKKLLVENKITLDEAFVLADKISCPYVLPYCPLTPYTPSVFPDYTYNPSKSPYFVYSDCANTCNRTLTEVDSSSTTVTLSCGPATSWTVTDLPSNTTISFA